MQSPFFSIIMPVYNVEKHLRKAVESLLSQEYKRFEIILVDDCSPDLCPGICDEYASRFDFIQVVHHKSNMGLSAARNTGTLRAAFVNQRGIPPGRIPSVRFLMMIASPENPPTTRLLGS